MSKVKITQIKSGIGYPKKQNARQPCCGIEWFYRRNGAHRKSFVKS